MLSHLLNDGTSYDKSTEEPAAATAAVKRRPCLSQTSRNSLIRVA